VRGAENELAVNSRSMMQIMHAFASHLDMPDADMENNPSPTRTESAAADDGRESVHIYSGKEAPANAFVAVHYRQHWFWIDDGDWRTKRAFSAIMFFFTLADTGGSGQLPLVTIPAQ
jgi:hypothetical protein